jgi:hypothetical protein
VPRGEAATLLSPTGEATRGHNTSPGRGQGFRGGSPGRGRGGADRGGGDKSHLEVAAAGEPRQEPSHQRLSTGAVWLVTFRATAHKFRSLFLHTNKSPTC